MHSVDLELKKMPQVDAFKLFNEQWQDGRIKLFVTFKLLHLRRAYRELFRVGEYIPLECNGERSGHVFAFMRKLGHKKILVIGTRGVLSATRSGTKGNKANSWDGHSLSLGSEELSSWRDIFWVKTYQDVRSKLHLSILLKKLPIVCLESL